MVVGNLGRIKIVKKNRDRKYNMAAKIQDGRFSDGYSRLSRLVLVRYWIVMHHFARSYRPHNFLIYMYIQKMLSF